MSGPPLIDLPPPLVLVPPVLFPPPGFPPPPLILLKDPLPAAKSALKVMLI